MLPPFIIEQIRKREQQEKERANHDQPRVDLPLQGPSARPTPRRDDEPERGVVIIEL